MLPSAIDDVELGISHVVRGEDHVSNTALQLQMFAAMQAAPPTFAHAALLTGSEGKLSKRLGSLGVDHFREAGIEPQAVLALLARIGTSQPVEPFADLAPLIAAFDFAHFGRAPGPLRRRRASPVQRPHRPPAAVSTPRATACRPA